MIRVVFNQKGGVGKSTIAVNLAAIAAERGKRTLVVDLDGQGNASQYLLGHDVSAATPTAADFFEQSLSYKLSTLPIESFVHRTPFENLDLMPASPDLADLHGKLESRSKILKLRKALHSLDGYDEIFIDTPPALNFYTRSALIAADACLIPFDCDDFSRQALYGLIEAVEDISADHNEDLLIEGIVVNQFQPRASLPARIVQELVDEGLPVLDSRLSSSVKIRESHDVSKPLVVCAPGHKLTAEFRALYDELETARKKARRKK
ncbi:MAG: ParA family protein [Burkholderiaceae bacterium]